MPMPRLPEDPEPRLRKARERVIVLGSGVFTVKTGFAVVRDPRQAAAVRERQAQAVQALLEWYQDGR
jgi:hypothetical protein